MTQNLQAIRVLLADDHALVRMGFRLLLEGAGAQVVAEADSGEQTLRCYADQPVDVLVMDVSMPGMGGLAALERLLASTSKARVLMLSAHHDDIIPMRALAMGALGYLCKRALPAEFLRAVGQVANGQRYLDAELAQSIALNQWSGTLNPVANLTEKELSIFLKLAEGRSVNQLASDFHLSPSTIGSHFYHIKQKLQVSNSAELTLVALRHGLIMN